MPAEPKANILFLGPTTSPLLHWIRENDAKTLQTEENISQDYIVRHGINIVVSYGYRHIIDVDTIAAVHGNVINLHISYLPWNRGAHPNFWGFIEDTPKGVSIHYIDAGIDTGDIIAQKRIEHFADDETLDSSYKILQKEIQALFKEHWENIKSKKCPRTKQVGEGSYHRARDIDEYRNLLTAGWDTPVSTIINAKIKPKLAP